MLKETEAKNPVRLSVYKEEYISWWIKCIGTTLLYFVLFFILLFVNGKYMTPVVETEKNLPELIWDSIISYGFAATVVISIIVDIILCRQKYVSNGRIILSSIVTIVLVAFDTVAIKYPLPQGWIVLVNFAVIIIYVFFC